MTDKNIQEAEVGSGTKISDVKQSEKRAQLTLKAIQLRLKQEKERAALQQQKKSLRVKEEVESIDELSTDKLADYKKKAGADATAADKAGDTKKGNKRFSGIMKATRKQFDNDAKKSVSEASQRVDSLVTDALKVMQGSELKDAVQALKTVLGDREYNDRRGHYNFYVKQLVDMYGKRDVKEAASPAQQAAIAIAMKKAGKTPKDMEESDAYDKDVKPSDKPHDKEAAAKRAKLAALAARKKNIKEAEGGGTSISSTGDASTAVKRAQVLLKSTQLRLKHDKEREAMAKQKQALRKEEEDKEYPEVKTGGKPLAKKFEKAFAKMGIKTNIKMKTVANTSINEKEDKKEENGKEAPAKQKAIKKGETLSGKQEPIKIDPEIESR
jgi:hypothetical protein